MNNITLNNMNSNIKKVALGVYGMWGALGFYRGFNEYPNTLYVERSIMGVMRASLYAFPLTLPMPLFVELINLESKCRKVNLERKNRNI